MTLIICSLASLPEVLEARRPSHVISLLSPEMMIAELTIPGEEGPDRHLRLSLHDIAAPTAGLVAPDAKSVEALLRFGQDWPGSAPMVVHCFAGISRSSASAFAIACARNPEASELDMALGLRRMAPHVFPNRRIIALADDILGRQGRLLDAVEAMGGDDLQAPHRPVDLPSRYPQRTGAP